MFWLSVRGYNAIKNKDATKCQKISRTVPCPVLESEIDRLVYQLYGLTEEVPSSARLSTYEQKEMSEEIKVVEGKE